VAKLDTPVENETEEEADEEIERLEAEMDNIKGVLSDLKEKVSVWKRREQYRHTAANRI
jgi:hypothetical protein